MIIENSSLAGEFVSIAISVFPMARILVFHRIDEWLGLEGTLKMI